MEAEIEHCARMIAQEAKLAGEAPSPETAEVHRQLLMLYGAQLKLLKLKPLR